MGRECPNQYVTPLNWNRIDMSGEGGRNIPISLAIEVPHGIMENLEKIEQGESSLEFRFDTTQFSCSSGFRCGGHRSREHHKSLREFHGEALRENYPHGFGSRHQDRETSLIAAGNTRTGSSKFRND